MLLATNASEIQIGLPIMVGIIAGILGGAGVFFAMKGDIRVLKQAFKSLENDNKNAHERITKVSDRVTNVEKVGPELQVQMKEMELRIIKAIQDIKNG